MNKAKPWLVGALLMVAAFVVWNAFLKPAPEMSEAIELRARALHLLGDHVLSEIKGARVLVLSNPYAKTASSSSKTRRFEDAAIRGLKASLADSKELIVAYPAIQPKYREQPEKASIPTDSSTPLSFIMEPNAIDGLLSEHGDCALVVSLVGLPLGVEESTSWKSELPFALLKPDLRVLGAKGKTRDAFQRKKILAAVVTERNSPDPLLVTDANIGDVLANNSDWLGFRARR